MTHPLIEIVGPDASGKTVLAEGLAERIGAKYVHLPSDADEVERVKIRASGNSHQLLEFYLGLNAKFTQENEGVLQKQPVIVEPYFTSTVASSILSGTGITTSPHHIIQPDFQIYLRPTDWDEIERRLVKRGEERKAHENLPHLRRLDQLYSAILPKKNILTLDTTKLRIEEALDLAEKEVKQLYTST
jgi:thymidylate kinase